MNFVVLFGTKIHEVYVDLYVDLWARTLAFYPRRVVEGPYPTWLVFKITHAVPDWKDLLFLHIVGLRTEVS